MPRHRSSRFSSSTLIGAGIAAMLIGSAVPATAAGLSAGGYVTDGHLHRLHARPIADSTKLVDGVPVMEFNGATGRHSYVTASGIEYISGDVTSLRSPVTITNLTARPHGNGLDSMSADGRYGFENSQIEILMGDRSNR